MQVPVEKWLAILALPLVLLSTTNIALAECGPEYLEQELACTASAWNNQTCTCEGGPVPGDPCQTGDVPNCYTRLMNDFQVRMAAAEAQIQELKQYCRDLQAWARSSGYQVPQHPCEY
jgi:hypothetical protein